MAVEEHAESRTRIALVHQGDPTDPASWSGVPARLVEGLERADCEVVPVRASFRGAGRLGRLLGMSWAKQATSRGFAAACGAAADRSLRRGGRLDGIVAIGSGYRLRSEVPIVTFEDMTLAQALAQGEPPYDSLGEAGARRWLARQRRIYEDARGCCVASDWAAGSVRQDYGIPAAKVHVVGVGRNIDAGRPGARLERSPFPLRRRRLAAQARRCRARRLRRRFASGAPRRRSTWSATTRRSRLPE